MFSLVILLFATAFCQSSNDWTGETYSIISSTVTYSFDWFDTTSFDWLPTSYTFDDSDDSAPTATSYTDDSDDSETSYDEPTITPSETSVETTSAETTFEATSVESTSVETTSTSSEIWSESSSTSTSDTAGSVSSSTESSILPSATSTLESTLFTYSSANDASVWTSDSSWYRSTTTDVVGVTETVTVTECGNNILTITSTSTALETVTEDCSDASSEASPEATSEVVAVAGVSNTSSANGEFIATPSPYNPSETYSVAQYVPSNHAQVFTPTFMALVGVLTLLL